jgi:hypothetical protein
VRATTLEGRNIQGEQRIDTTKKARRERGTGRLWQIGDVWYMQYYVSGLQVRKSSGSTSETFAKKLLQKRLGEAAGGICGDLRRPKYQDLRRGFFDD